MSCETLMDFLKLNGDGDQRIKNSQSDTVNERPSKQSRLTNLCVIN